MKKQLFSIIIPLYNEKWNIIPLLEEFYKFIDKHNFELILVNDWSKDWTKEFLEKLDSKYLSFSKIISYEKNKWYWWAILTWLKEAKWNTLWWMHSDLQTDIKYTFEWYDKYLKENNKNILIKWNREDRRMWQIFFSNTMWIICTIIFWYKLFEINAQPKIFSKELYKKFNNAPLDFSLDLYLLVLAKKNWFTFKTINVNFIDRVYWSSKWKTSFKLIIKTITRSLIYIIKLRLWKK